MHWGPWITWCCWAIPHDALSTNAVKNNSPTHSVSSCSYGSKTNLKTKNITKRRRWKQSGHLIFFYRGPFLPREESILMMKNCRPSLEPTPKIWFHAFNAFLELQRAGLHFGAALSLDRQDGLIDLQVARAIKLVDRSTSIVAETFIRFKLNSEGFLVFLL
jgi:hypothetical protein